MPDSKFLVQTERYTFLELLQNSAMPVFTTDYSRNAPPDTIPSHAAVPITDPEFNVSCYFPKDDRLQLQTVITVITAVRLPLPQYSRHSLSKTFPDFSADSLAFTSECLFYDPEDSPHA